MRMRLFVVMNLLVACVCGAAMGQTPVVEKVSAVVELRPLEMVVDGRVLESGAGKGFGTGFGVGDYVAQWPGVYFEAAFVGTEVYFRVGMNHEILHVLVDGAAPLVLVKPEVGVYRVTGLAAGRHAVKVMVVTESQDAPNTFGGFGLARGEKALKAERRKRQIEFIGDSHTVGYGNTSAKGTCSNDEVWATTDDSQAFGAMTAGHYGADYQVNAISGRGVVRNYAGFAADKLPEAYPYVLFDKKQTYADAGWKPQVIVMALGTNDFSTALNAGEQWKTRDELHADYEKTYVRFLQGLRMKNPGAYFVLWGTDIAGGEIEAEERRVVEQVKALGETRIAFVAVDPLEFKGCHGHPSVKDDGRIAEKLEGVIDGAGVWGR